RLLVVAVLELTDLNLVDALEFAGVQAELPADLRCGLRRPHRHRVSDHRRRVRQVASAGAGLVTAEVGQRRPRRPGVEATVDVAARLSVSDQYQPASHGLPSRSLVNQRDASSSRGGAAPAADPVGHEPRNLTPAQRRCSALSASATASSSMCPTQSRKKKYVPNSFRVGRDSMRVRSMSRIANSVRADTSASGALSGGSTTEVRSAPVRLGGAPGGPASTNRVRALGSSTTSVASAVRP